MEARKLILDILYYAIQLIILLAMGYFITYLKTRIGTEKTKEYYDLAKRIVLAAEQVFGPKTGEQKKDFVMKFLKQRIPYLTEDEITNLVEAAVFEMNAMLKKHELENDTPG
ncbi:MAG TPA: phage holin [Thermoanaerobacterales bacterium]|nr:phage holin [Thermoanaerobacterales bacterium]